jgi:DNA polymerase-4
MGGIDRTRDWPKVIVHVDMDAFFAAFEIRNAPQLKGKPVIVGGDPRYRSVVSTCSYEARKFGVKSGMSMAQAKKLCPEGVVISGSLGGYVYTASVLQVIFEHYSPIVEPFSVDEAFLDITGCHRIFHSSEALVMKMKAEIREKLSLTCSVGIAPSKLIAKMASGEKKPDGITIMDREDFRKAFYPRPVSSLWGIGEKTQKALSKLGINTVGELAGYDEKVLKGYFGVNGAYLSRVARGEDCSEVISCDELPDDKSMSHETTLVTDLSDIDKIYATLLWLSDKVSRRLRRDNFVARTISVKIRSSEFDTVTRDKTISTPTDQCKIIFETSKRLIPREYGPKVKVRLLGVKASNLLSKTGEKQLSLLSNIKMDKLKLSSNAVDKIKNRYGEAIVKFAGEKM